MKQRPRNTVLGSRADHTYLFAIETKRSCESLRVISCEICHMVRRTDRDLEINSSRDT